MKLDAKTVAGLRLDGKTDAIFFDSAMPRFGFRLRLAAGAALAAKRARRIDAPEHDLRVRQGRLVVALAVAGRPRH